MIRVALAAIAAGAAFAVPATGRDDDLAKELAGRAPGKPVDCIDQSRLMGPVIIDERTILYRESGRRVWRNDLPGECRGLRPLSTLIVELYGSQLCRNDHFRTLEPGSTIPSAYCRFGSFTPYDRIK